MSYQSVYEAIISGAEIPDIPKDAKDLEFVPLIQLLRPELNVAPVNIEPTLVRPHCDLETYVRAIQLIERPECVDIHDASFWSDNTILPYIGGTARTEHAITRELRPGEPTVVSRETAHATLNTISYGIVDQIVGLAPNIVISGGSVLQSLRTNSHDDLIKLTDIDIWLIGTEEEKIKSLFLLLDFFENVSFSVRQPDGCVSQHRPEKFYSIRNSVISVYFKGIARKFQILLQKEPSTYKFLEMFDFTCNMVAYHDGHFLATPAAVLALMTQTTSIGASKHIHGKRAFKILRMGFDLKDDNLLMDELNDTLKKPAEYTKLLTDLLSVYHPVETYSLPDNLVQMMYIENIKKDAMTNQVYTTIKEVKANIVVDFTNFGYGLKQYSDLHSGIVTIGRGQWNLDGAKPKFITPTFKIERITVLRRGTAIVTIPDESLKADLDAFKGRTKPEYHCTNFTIVKTRLGAVRELDSLEVGTLVRVIHTVRVENRYNKHPNLDFMANKVIIMTDELPDEPVPAEAVSSESSEDEIVY